MILRLPADTKTPLLPFLFCLIYYILPMSLRYDLIATAVICLYILDTVRH